MAGRKQFDPERALQAAVHLFWEKGFLGTSVHDLEAAMGVGRASIYATYGDKEDLFLQALGSYVGRYGPPVQEAFRVHADDSIQALRATFDAALFRMSDPELPAGCLVAQSAADLASLGERTKAVVSELVRTQRTIIATALEADRRRGRLEASADTEALAAFLTGTIHSLSILHRNQVGLEVLRRVADHAVATLPAHSSSSN